MELFIFLGPTANTLKYRWAIWKRLRLCTKHCIQIENDFFGKFVYLGNCGSLSSGSPCVPVLAFLLLLKFTDFPRIEDLYFGLPLLVVAAEDGGGGDLDVLGQEGGVIAEGDEVSG